MESISDIEFESLCGDRVLLVRLPTGGCASLSPFDVTSLLQLGYLMLVQFDLAMMDT